MSFHDSAVDGKRYYVSAGILNAVTNLTNYYGSIASTSLYTFNASSSITSFTNVQGILAAGGSASGGGNTGGVGGHAINNSFNGIIIKNYGYLLGGGGGASGALGGAGGGGGGAGSNTGTGGSIIVSINGGGSNPEQGGGGGGPGGNGGRGGSLGGGSPGANGGLTPANTVTTSGFTYGGGGGKDSTQTYLFGGGGGYGGGNGSGTGGGYFGGGGGGGGGGIGGLGAAPPSYPHGGNGGYSIYNSGTITELYNSQGGKGYRYGPLFYGGTALPTKYYITANSQTNYGQLYYTGWGAPTSLSLTNIDIDPISAITSPMTFTAVLVGNYATISNASKITLLNSGAKVTWSIVQSNPVNVTIGIIPYNSYDLTITNIQLSGQVNASSLYLSGYLKDYSVTNPAFSSPSVSAYANYIIASGVGFAVNSDERIKKNIQYLSSTDSFELVKSLKPASFQYIDSMKGTVPKYGYLAQEVESVLPNAVYKTIGYITNIFEMVKIENDNRNKIILKEKTTESLAIGTKVQFYDTKNNSFWREVVEIMDEKTFIINEPFLEDIDSLFLYGQEVEDYRSIDTDQIYTVMLSALQEAQTKLEKQQKQIDELREK